ncbi:hypothetical protein LTR10_009164 [Elasticomyces elasticus]|nr:hypothetical protein LTR10_009164 [Elasticomyces elasticus]KAK4971733.1 hypothetical protein LTR42_007461 [Elasticomyces elasticus]
MDASHLARLPAELRNQIYDLTTNGLVNQTHRYIVFEHYSQSNTTALVPNRKVDSGIALSRTCKQLREECGARLYSNSIVYVTVYQGPEEEAKINYVRIMRKIVSRIGLDNVFLCRDMELRIATKAVLSSISSSEQAIAPAIKQLYPWSTRSRIPLRIRLGYQLPLLELLDLGHSCDTVLEELALDSDSQQENIAVALWLPRVCEGVRASEARKLAIAKKSTAGIKWMVGSEKGCKALSKAESKAVVGHQTGGDGAVNGSAPRSISNSGEAAQATRLALWLATCKWVLGSW